MTADSRADPFVLPWFTSVMTLFGLMLTDILCSVCMLLHWILILSAASIVGVVGCLGGLFFVGSIVRWVCRLVV